MATATVATAAGMAIVLYFVLSRRLLAREEDRIGGGVGGGDVAKMAKGGGRRRVAPRRPAQPPSTWREAVATLAETLRFTYSETLGKWPIGDLAFGIKYLMRQQGDLHVASVYAGSDCVELKGPDVMAKLIHYVKLVNQCYLFSKRPFPVFLESAGYSQEDVLLQEPKAGLLKPAFTVLHDKDSKCFLLLVRGTHSMKDTLTAATGAVVPFHHSVLDEDGVKKLVLGYAHCGMVAAARWIAKLTTPCLLKAVNQHPDHKIMVVGHSLGGGTAALLTYILREHKEFFASTCVAFAPAACMTWDLAESGKDFVTAIINGSDIVPTFSAASVDDLRLEVTASSWLNDLRDQVQRTKILNVIYRSASALGSRLPSISSARARVAGAGALLRPVSSRTQVVVKRAQNVAEAVARSRSSLSSWSCIGARRRVLGGTKEEKASDLQSASLRDSETIVVEHCNSEMSVDDLQFDNNRGSDEEIEVEEDEELIPADQVTGIPTAEDFTEGDLWFELEKEFDRQNDPAVIQAQEEVAAAAKEIIEEENAVLETVEDKQSHSADAVETHQFYPPGRIMHMVVLPKPDAHPAEDFVADENNVRISETPRYLYSKIRLSRNMINDHYMPMYKRMMELLIDKFAKDEDGDRDLLS